MSLFVTLVIGRCRRNSVERRTWLGGAGVGTVAASGLAAYGICSALGESRGCGGGAEIGDTTIVRLCEGGKREKQRETEIGTC